MTRRQHFVMFLSPGTVYDETSQRPVESWDPKTAAKTSREITERHGARPYAFKFQTHIVSDQIPDGEGGTLEVKPKKVAESGLHYIDGVVIRFDDVADTHENSVLRSNMSGNGMWVVCKTRNGFRHTGEFGEKDVVVDSQGSIIKRGDDPDLAAYRAAKSKEKRRS